MDLNGTFFVELLIFSIFYYFVKSRIWPRFAGVLEERQLYIANGLQAAKEGQALLQDAHKEADLIIQKAHRTAKDLAEHTHQEMSFFKDQIRKEMDELKLNVQKEVLAECDQMRVVFLAQARVHYLEVASSLCEKVLLGHPDFCQKALEEALPLLADGLTSSSALN